MSGAYYNEKQYQYERKYLESQDRITLKYPKGTKERWILAAENEGYSNLTKYIEHCVEEHIKNQERR